VKHVIKRAGDKIWYISGNEALLDEIKALWEELNQHHMERSIDFNQHYSDMTFEKRKQALLNKAEKGEMRVDLAVDEESGNKVGYCISSIDDEKTGEIESIYVAEQFRRQGTGNELILKALAWMDQKGAEKKTVAVGAGNEEAFSFYRKYGFLPRKTILEQT
jgi:diamine N-acetyltransferase